MFHPLAAIQVSDEAFAKRSALPRVRRASTRLVGGLVRFALGPLAQCREQAIPDLIRHAVLRHMERAGLGDHAARRSELHGARAIDVDIRRALLQSRPFCKNPYLLELVVCKIAKRNVRGFAVASEAIAT
jgi:hypothetical protein